MKASSPLTIHCAVALMLGAITLMAHGAAREGVLSAFSKDALERITPSAYKVEAAMRLPSGPGKAKQYLFGLSDEIADFNDLMNIPARAPMLILAESDHGLVVHDRVHIEPADGGGPSDMPAGLQPNYFIAMSEQEVGAATLYLVTSRWFGGGSGSADFFDFYRVQGGHLQLLKRFMHGRMEQPYFAIYRKAIYDGVLRCERGAKHGKAYVYTCRIDVTKYAYDGEAVRALATEPLRVRSGNRYLGDSYRFVSVLKALANKEVFADQR